MDVIVSDVIVMSLSVMSLCDVIVSDVIVMSLSVMSLCDVSDVIV